MNECSGSLWSTLLLGCGLAALLTFPADAEKLGYSKALDAGERQCLNDIIQTSSWKYSREFWREMMQIAEVAKTHLESGSHMDYFLLFEGDGWCGTGGCPLLIGETGKGNGCRLLYDDSGFNNMSVLKTRDHGYRRLYTPCEARFDGRHYRQLHAACPSVDVQR